MKIIKFYEGMINSSFYERYKLYYTSKIVCFVFISCLKCSKLNVPAKSKKFQE